MVGFYFHPYLPHPVQQDARLPTGEEDRRRGPRFSLLTGTLALSAIALLGGYLIVNLVLMPSLTRQGAEVRVPEVVGLSEREAERALAEEELKGMRTVAEVERNAALVEDRSGRVDLTELHRRYV